jgi:hypothetical protein
MFISEFKQRIINMYQNKPRLGSLEKIYSFQVLTEANTVAAPCSPIEVHPFMTDATSTTEMLVDFYQTTRTNNTENVA